LFDKVSSFILAPEMQSRYKETGLNRQKHNWS